MVKVAIAMGERLGIPVLYSGCTAMLHVHRKHLVRLVPRPTSLVLYRKRLNSAQHFASAPFQNTSPASSPWTPIPSPSLHAFPSTFSSISKSRLSILVTLTTLCGYALAPTATLSIPILINTTLGTGLCVASANAWNQWLESNLDGHMQRTKQRVLVTQRVSPLYVATVGVSTGVLGTCLLAWVDPIAAGLGASNILLYAYAYTRHKRTSIYNTWTGAVVGALPPMIGWTAACHALPCSGLSLPGVWILACLLYSWQFPHFNALSWLGRADYVRAGYTMCAPLRPDLNARVSLRHSLILSSLSFLTPWSGLCTWWFALDSGVLNAYLLIKAVQFWKRSGKKQARELFFASLVHLPVMLALMLLHKNTTQPTLEYEDDEDLDHADMENTLHVS